MSSFHRAARLLLSTTLAVPVAAQAALPMHRAPRAPTPSTLPAPHLIGEPASRLGRTYGGTPIDVTTYHYDQNRTGWNATETDLTVASVTSSKFGLLKSLSVKGNVFAQPLILSNFGLPDGTTRNVLIIATSHNMVYAFDAQTYASLWSVSLGTPQNSNDVGCGDSIPEYGISATPAIVRSGSNAATIYVVAATEPSSGTFVSTLHALNAGTGADSVTPVVINPSPRSPTAQP